MPKNTSERTILRLIEKRDRAQERLNAANDIEVTCPNCQSLVTVQDITTCGACERFICENCTVFVEVMDCCSPCAVSINEAAKAAIEAGVVCTSEDSVGGDHCFDEPIFLTDGKHEKCGKCCNCGAAKVPTSENEIPVTDTELSEYPGVEA